MADSLAVHAQNGWQASANKNPTVSQLIAALAALPPDTPATVKVASTTYRVSTVDDTTGLITAV
jgi:hypothetical protein